MTLKAKNLNAFFMKNASFLTPFKGTETVF